MHIKIISDEKLKVTLTATDLERYGIRIEDIDYDNTETRRVFWTILDQAKLETGFNAATSRIFIQIYPDTAGGCEMYVSKVKKRGDDTVNVHSASLLPKEHIYRIETLDHLLSACKALAEIGFSESSSAYADSEKDEYYLILDCAPNQALPLSEYGEKCDGKYEKYRILERCTPICESNAIETLSKLMK